MIADDKMQIPITRVVFDQCEIENIVKPLETGWVVQGPYVAEFQKRFADFVGARHAHATTSCTTALHLALEAFGISAGDKVIVPSFTYVATANAVEYTGAEVVFCDIDLNTFNLNVSQVETLVQKDRAIKAVIPVNLFGLCADLPEIMRIAKKYNLKVIEDSACGFDSWIGDKHSGTFGDIGCFSFHPRKSLCTGEGGMIITDDDGVAAVISQLKDHGASKSDIERSKEKGAAILPDFKIRGYNYRMTDLQGVLGVCQMKKADYIMAGRRKIALKFDKELTSIDELAPPVVPDNYRHGYQSYICLFSDGIELADLSFDDIEKLNLKRNSFMCRLEEKRIATRQGTHAIHTLDYYKNKMGFKDRDFPKSYIADRLSIALPLYTEMSDKEFEYIIRNIKEALL